MPLNTLPPATRPPATTAAAHIVIVDDEPLNTDALAEHLRSAGHPRVVGLPGRGLTALALRDEQPDLVLLELALTDNNAFDVLRWMQADRALRHVPTIVLTTQGDRASRLRALELGATDFLVKPVDAAELELRLRNTLAAKAYRDRLAHTDPLTGLPNREALLWRLDWALKHALRKGSVGAVLHLGLGRYKELSDTLGPALGDELLHAVSQRLVAGLRDSDTVVRSEDAQASAVLARGNGDEFTVLLPLVERAEDAAVVARRMTAHMAEPFALAGHELYLSCRVGIAVFPADSADKDAVLQQASVAMRHAQPPARGAGGGLKFYSEELNAQSLHRLNLERELHHALERQEFTLHYQAQVDMASGRLCGAEALLRWQHPQRGLLAPGEFLAVAEDTGLIAPIGDWVLRAALRQWAQWRSAGLVLAQMAVNVSSQQLQQPGLCADVQLALHAAGAPGAALCLELTESAIIDSGPLVMSTLAAIKQLGVKLALDDFGTGYSSLTYLRRFPIDEIKIDRSFVTDCDSDANNAAITAAIVAMAHGLGLRVVAEGVETPRQLDVLRNHGADAFQGYLFARPLPADEFCALLFAPQRTAACV